MVNKRIDGREPSARSDSTDRRGFSLAAATFILVFAVGFLITNWMAFVPHN